MSNILALAEDFLERMSNPAYGIGVNEEYAMKFARLLEDEQFEGQLNQQISDVNDADALTSHAWLWVIGWAKSQGVVVQEHVLIELFERWSNVAVKASIIDLVMDGLEERQVPDPEVALSEFPVRFFAGVMRNAVEIPERPSLEWRRENEPFDYPPEMEEPQPSLARAEGLLVALLQVGVPMTLAAASVLLRHGWRGQKQLGEFYESLLARLEPDTREEWERRIGGRFA
jgi:hypothetical protein